MAAPNHMWVVRGGDGMVVARYITEDQATTYVRSNTGYVAKPMTKDVTDGLRMMAAEFMKNAKGTSAEAFKGRARIAEAAANEIDQLRSNAAVTSVECHSWDTSGPTGLADALGRVGRSHHPDDLGHAELCTAAEEEISRLRTLLKHYAPKLTDDQIGVR